MSARVRLADWIVLCGVLGACGGAEPLPQPSAAVAPAAASSGAEATAAAAGGGMQVEGILGKISERRIEETMQAKLPAFQRCFFAGSEKVEFLAGHFKFYFRVGSDGQVESVDPRGSSVGQRSTELCLLDIARKTRFPKPQGGGAAEFVWGFEIDAPGGVRPPVAWTEERVADSVREQRSSLAACALGDGRYTITVYVAPGGTVLSAGAASDSPAASAKIDCLLGAISGWHLPDPGSYPAKVSFNL